MLAKKPSDRYQTATDLIADLHEVAFRDGLSRSQTLNPVTITPDRPLVVWLERHAPWIVAATLLIVTRWLVAVGIGGIPRRDDDPEQRGSALRPKRSRSP